MNYQETYVGQPVLLDGTIQCEVTKTGVYVNSLQEREVGVSVRPANGGRARPVSVSRLSPLPGSRRIDWLGQPYRRPPK
jgi:hypothetical protein